MSTSSPEGHGFSARLRGNPHASRPKPVPPGPPLSCCSTLRAALTSRSRTRPQPCILSASVFGLSGARPASAASPGGASRVEPSPEVRGQTGRDKAEAGRVQDGTRPRVHDQGFPRTLHDCNRSRFGEGPEEQRERPGKLEQERVGVKRRILNVTPGQTRQMLECKAARRGGTVITVELQDTSMPSSIYGSVSDGPRKSRANFMCRDCGHEENADLNAARNIRFHALQARAMIGLLAATGMRRSEATGALRLRDLTADGLEVRNAKFGKSRLLPLHGSVTRALDAYLA